MASRFVATAAWRATAPVGLLASAASAGVVRRSGATVAATVAAARCSSGGTAVAVVRRAVAPGAAAAAASAAAAGAAARGLAVRGVGRRLASTSASASRAAARPPPPPPPPPPPAAAAGSGAGSGAGSAGRRRRWPYALAFSAGAAPLLLLAYIRPPGGALATGDLDPVRPTVYSDFSDTRSVFGAVPTWRLIETLVIYRVCSHAWLVDHADKLLSLLPKPVARLLLKPTVYQHFVAGEDLPAAVETMRAKYVPINVSCMLFYSVENANTPKEWDRVQALVTRLLREGAAAGRGSGPDGRPAVEFVPLKITALTDDAVLHRVADWLRYQQRFPDKCAEDSPETAHLAAWHPEPLPFSLPPVSRAAMSEDAAPPPQLTAADRALLDDVVSRVNTLADEAERLGLRILLDAEQVELQPAIDYIALRVMQYANRKGKEGRSEEHDDGRTIVYNTYQCYLRSTPDKIAAHLQHAAANDYVLGLKIVRGAYLESERNLARAENLPDPIQPSKMATDHAYNAAVASVIPRVAQGSAAVMVATHNLESVVLAAQAAHAVDMRPDHSRLHFGQLMGMGWNLTLALSHMGFNVSKLLPFGEVDVVLPYLIRRLQENKDVMAGAQYERQLMFSEIKRRAGPYLGRIFF